jgi:plastocyanin
MRFSAPVVVALVSLTVLAIATTVLRGNSAFANPADTQAVSMTTQPRVVPDPITITINVGTTVTWTNVTTNIPHTTTSDTGI